MDLSTSSAAARAQQLPVVSFARFLAGDASGKLQVAREIGRACEDIGFFYLADHGIAPERIDAMFEATRRLFALPEETKLDPALRITPEWNRGYQPLAAKQFAGTTSPDLVETFKFQKELPADDADIAAGDRVHRRNRWPREMPPQLRATLQEYFDSVEGLMHRLLGAFALALELPEGYFERFYRKPITQISLLHYPPQPPRALETDYGLRPHTDATSFTILAQDEVGGIQVQSRQGWVDARPIAGTFLINIGDMMARWTNDRFASTMHRVYNKSGRERYSAPFFAIPDFDATVECLPSCLGPGAQPKYPPLHVGESLRDRFASNWRKDPPRA